MSGSSVVPSSRNPSLEMRRSRSSSSLNDDQLAASISRTVSPRKALSRLRARRRGRSAMKSKAKTNAGHPHSSALNNRPKLLADVFVNRVLDRLRPIKIVAYRISNQNDFSFGQTTFKNFTRNLLEITNIYRVNNLFATILFHRCVQSQTLLVKNVFPVPPNGIVVGINLPSLL